MSANHYENFPVASFLLPKHLRQAVLNIYRFARSADDIADEGDASDARRLHALKTYRDALNTFHRSAAAREKLPVRYTAVNIISCLSVIL